MQARRQRSYTHSFQTNPNEQAYEQNIVERLERQLRQANSQINVLKQGNTNLLSNYIFKTSEGNPTDLPQIYQKLSVKTKKIDMQEKQILELKERIEVLTRQISDKQTLAQKLEQQQQRNYQLQEQNYRLGHDIRALTEDTLKLKAELQKQTISPTSSRKSTTTQPHKEVVLMKDTLDQMQERITEKKKQNQKLLKQIKRLETNLHASQNLLAISKGQIAVWQKKCLSGINKERQRCKKQIQQKEKKLKQLSISEENLQQENYKLNKAIIILKKKILQVSPQAKDIFVPMSTQAIIHYQQSQCGSIHSEVIQSNLMIPCSHSDNPTAKDNFSKSKKRLTNLQNQLQMQSSWPHSQPQSQKGQQQSEGKSNVGSSTRHDICKYDRLTKALEKQCRTSQEKIRALQREISMLQLENLKQKDVIQAEKTKVGNKYDQQVKRLERDLKASQSQNNQLRSQLNKFDQEKQQQISVLKGIATDVQVKLEQLSKVRKQNQRLSKEVEFLQKNGTLESKLIQSDAMMKKIQNQLQFQRTKYKNLQESHKEKEKQFKNSLNHYEQVFSEFKQINNGISSSGPLKQIGGKYQKNYDPHQHQHQRSPSQHSGKLTETQIQLKQKVKNLLKQNQELRQDIKFQNQRVNVLENSNSQLRKQLIKMIEQQDKLRKNLIAQRVKSRTNSSRSVSRQRSKDSLISLLRQRRERSQSKQGSQGKGSLNGLISMLPLSTMDNNNSANKHPLTDRQKPTQPTSMMTDRNSTANAAQSTLKQFRQKRFNASTIVNNVAPGKKDNFQATEKMNMREPVNQQWRPYNNVKVEQKNEESKPQNLKKDNPNPNPNKSKLFVQTFKGTTSSTYRYKYPSPRNNSKNTPSTPQKKNENFNENVQKSNERNKNRFSSRGGGRLQTQDNCNNNIFKQFGEADFNFTPGSTPGSTPIATVNGATPSNKPALTKKHSCSSDNQEINFEISSSKSNVSGNRLKEMQLMQLMQQIEQQPTKGPCQNYKSNNNNNNFVKSHISITQSTDDYNRFVRKSKIAGEGKQASGSPIRNNTSNSTPKNSASGNKNNHHAQYY